MTLPGPMIITPYKIMGFWKILKYGETQYEVLKGIVILELILNSCSSIFMHFFLKISICSSYFI